MTFKPAYRSIASAAFQDRVREAYRLLESCSLCGRHCGVDRTADGIGACGTGRRAFVSSHGPHYGEERPLVGSHGSGTIFFASCNLGCVFCQNHEISHGGDGVECSAQSLASMMLGLQATSCHNINLVTPTHQVPVILQAIMIASARGLVLPIVWNCGAYESLEALALLDGVVDVYMPDFKFWDEEASARYLGARDYPTVAREALLEMHRQVGDLTMDEHGVATRGLLVRHLVMPGNLAGTDRFVAWLAREVSPRTYLNVMAQYHPCHVAHLYPEINRRPTRQEVEQARSWARAAGLRLDND